MRLNLQKNKEGLSFELLSLHSSLVTHQAGAKRAIVKGTQRIVSVNYLFRRPLTPSDFLTRIVTSNFYDMRNLMSVNFGLSKMLFWVPRKGQLSFPERW